MRILTFRRFLFRCILFRFVPFQLAALDVLQLDSASDDFRRLGVHIVRMPLTLDIAQLCREIAGGHRAHSIGHHAILLKIVPLQEALPFALHPFGLHVLFGARQNNHQLRRLQRVMDISFIVIDCLSMHGPRRIEYPRAAGNQFRIDQIQQLSFLCLLVIVIFIRILETQENIVFFSACAKIVNLLETAVNRPAFLLIIRIPLRAEQARLIADSLKLRRIARQHIRKVIPPVVDNIGLPLSSVYRYAAILHAVTRKEHRPEVFRRILAKLRRSGKRFFRAREILRKEGAVTDTRLFSCINRNMRRGSRRLLRAAFDAVFNPSAVHGIGIHQRRVAFLTAHRHSSVVLCILQ